jgi:signal transduction histidine kinase/CHASE3 domain sensor protein/GAF domain-containing protein
MTLDTASSTAFRRLLSRAVVVPAALLAVLAVVFLCQILYLMSAAQWVNHTSEVIAEGNVLLRLLVDRESRMRAYLVTGEPVFLELYQREEGSIGSVFAGMKQLVSDNPPQVERLEALEAEYPEWQIYARKVLALRRDGGDYLTVTHSMEGKLRMDRMRVQIAAFIQIEEDLRDMRSRTARSATWAVIGMSISVTLLLGGFLAVFTRRQLVVVSTNYQNALNDAEAKADSLRTSAQRFEALHEIDQAILAANSVPDLIRSALCRMERVVPSDEAFVVLFNSAGEPDQTIFCNEQRERQAPGEAIRSLTDMGPSEFADRNDSSMVLDLADVATRTPIQDRLLHLGYRSCVAVPLQAQGQRFGGMVLAAARPTAFNGEHQLVTEEVSRQLSIAIQQSRMREQLQHNADALEGRVLERTGELQEALEYVKDRQQALVLSNERIAALDQKARDLAFFVETTRQQALLQSDKKIEALDVKARALANFVETLQNQTRQQSDTEIEALGQQARDLALFVEAVRKETRLKSEMEIATLGQQARDLAVSIENVREMTLLHSDTEIKDLKQKAINLALSVETTREKALLNSVTEIQGLKQTARNLAISVETVREKTLLNSHTEIEDLKQKANSLAISVENSRINTLVESEKVIRKLNEDLEHRILERTCQLETANKELESFSYSVSHDLRSPLRAIDGFSRILLEDHSAALGEDAKGYLHQVRNNTRQMGKLVDDLLTFSRLGRSSLTKDSVDPTKIVGLYLAETQKERAGRQVEISVGDLPCCQADQALLKQVWMNLLSNAMKYSHKQEIARIAIGSRTAQRPAGSDMETIYFVKDNGAGFDMKYVHKLFGVFQRLHRASDYEGTGVGLAIVQRIINRHGGRVWAEGEVNKGATFSFTLE